MPWGYQPYPIFQPAPQQQGIAGVRFVNGQDEARTVAIPYGTRALFMDANEDTFYIKETDVAGASTVETYRFEKVEPQRVDYVTRAEFEELKRAYESALQQNGQPAKQQPDAAAYGAYQANQPTAGQAAGAALNSGARDNSAGMGSNSGASFGNM